MIADPINVNMMPEVSLQTIQLKSSVGSDGMLHIPWPELKDSEVDIIVVYQPINTSLKAPPKRQWSPEFLSVFGAWEGEPLVRAEQEEPSERESF